MQWILFSFDIVELIKVFKKCISGCLTKHTCLKIFVNQPTNFSIVSNIYKLSIIKIFFTFILHYINKPQKIPIKISFSSKLFPDKTPSKISHIKQMDSVFKYMPTFQNPFLIEKQILTPHTRSWTSLSQVITHKKVISRLAMSAIFVSIWWRPAFCRRQKRTRKLINLSGTSR